METRSELHDIFVKNGGSMLILLILCLGVGWWAFTSTDTTKATSAPDPRKIRGEHLTTLQMGIALNGHICEKANEGRLMGRTNRGDLEFKVVCNDFEFVYRVIVPARETDPWLVENFFK